MDYHDIFGTVVDVTSQSGNSKKTQKSYTIYFVTMDDGNTYKCFNKTGAPIAALAQSLKNAGTPAKAKVHSEPSQGDYPDDLFIDGIEAASGAVAEARQVLDEYQPPTQTPTPNGAANLQGPSPTMTPAIRGKDEDIRTLWAIKSAVHYVTSNGTGNAEQDLTMVGYLAQEYYRMASEGVQGVGESKKELPVW